jgi:glutaryl-CoA dehydrogenase
VKAPPATDFYLIRNLLADEDLQVQELVARFVEKRVMPIISEAFDEHRFPQELVEDIGELGLLGCNLEGYGCAGLGNIAYGLVCQELERGDSGIRSFASVQSSLVMYPIHAYGSEEQKEKWLPRLAKGKAIGCFGLTEPDGGSDPAAMNTHAEKIDGGWILNGSKIWITNGGIADIAVVWARTEDGIRGFLVEKGMEGFATRDIYKKFSLRASVTSELFFDDVRLPDGNLLPTAVGLASVLRCLTQARYGICWGVIGAAIACFEEALDYTGSRVLFGRPLAHTQTIQRRLAEMCRRITSAQLLSLQLGRLKDGGEMHHAQVSLAKWNNVRAALEVARDARDMLGGAGITIEHGAIRHMLNLESVMTYEGTETIHELVVGGTLCGKSAF